VVLGLELECDSITNRCVYSSGIVGKGATSADHDRKILGSRYSNNGDKSSNNSRETHFFKVKRRVIKLFGESFLLQRCVLIKLESSPARGCLR